jgi:hypothetical protein
MIGFEPTTELDTALDQVIQYMRNMMV